MAEIAPKSKASEAAAVLSEVMWWHAGWALALVLAAAVLLLTTHDADLPVWLALAAGLAPTVGALSLRQDEARPRRLMVLVLWALTSVLACGLTGGLAGPLAIWCIAPLAAAAVLGGGRPLAQGASLSLAAFALVSLAQAGGLVADPPSDAASFDLAVLALATTSLGLAAALLLSRRRFSRGSEIQNLANAELHAILLRQPHLILILDRFGRVGGAYGLPPPGVDPDRLFSEGLPALALGEDRAGLAAAIAIAERDGLAKAGFALDGAEGTWLEIDLRRMSDGRLIATLRDAGEARRREQALESARVDAEALNVGKSRFLANMSHELRTPLNAIMGFSDIMRQRMFGTLPGKYVEYADLIHDAGSHLLDLINDVLDMSKIEAARYELSLERLDAREPVQAALRLMRLQADDAGVQLRGVLPHQPLEADADRRAIKQIVLNLVSNALKFTPRGGLVTVSIQPLAGALELSVADTGLGISKADLDRLGRPYEQAGDAHQQARGTGLGLSLVRALSELHGGDMAIESRLGEGTAVTVRLPVLAPDSAQAETAPRLGAQVIPFNLQR